MEYQAINIREEKRGNGYILSGNVEAVRGQFYEAREVWLIQAKCWAFL